MNEALRKIVHEHMWRHDSYARDGQGRLYGWSKDELDALIKDVIREYEKGGTE